MRLCIALNRFIAVLVEYPAIAVLFSLAALLRGVSLWRGATVACAAATVVLAGCIRRYNLARRRVQEVADRLDVGVRLTPGFRFASELHELFELWRRRSLFWRALDYCAVAHMVVFVGKLLRRAECAAVGYQVMPLAVLSLNLIRLLFRDRVSSANYSLLSLAANSMVWLTHCGFLLTGDVCFGAIARGPYSGTLPAQVAFACAALAMMNLITPVSQAFVSMKLGIAFLGSLSSSYMHMLYQDGGLHSELDPQGWSLFWLCVGLSASSIATFHANTRLLEAGMTRFLRVHFADGEQ